VIVLSDSKDEPKVLDIIAPSPKESPPPGPPDYRVVLSRSKSGIRAPSVKVARPLGRARSPGRRGLLLALIMALLITNSLWAYWTFVQVREEHDNEVASLTTRINHLESQILKLTDEMALRRWLNSIDVRVRGSGPDGLYYSDDTHSTPTTITLGFTSLQDQGVACQVYLNVTLSRDGSIVANKRLGPGDPSRGNSPYDVIRDSTNLKLGRHTLIMVVWCEGSQPSAETMRQVDFVVPRDSVVPTITFPNDQKDGERLEVSAKVSDNIRVQMVTISVWLISQNGTVRIADNQSMSLVEGSDLWEFSSLFPQGPETQGQLFFKVTASDTSNNVTTLVWYDSI